MTAQNNVILHISCMFTYKNLIYYVDCGMMLLMKKLKLHSLNIKRTSQV